MLIPPSFPHLLIGLAKSLGVEYIDELCKGANASYTSERILHEVVQTLAIQSFIIQRFPPLKTSQFFSILVDETTDVAAHKDLIIYAKFLNEQREVTTSFVGLLQLSDGRADYCRCIDKTLGGERRVGLSG